MPRFVLGLVFVLGAAALYAQTQNAEINGLVTDQAGAVVPGASVTVTSTATRISRVVRSNETGNYVIFNLPPGPYRVEVGKEGFQKAVSDSVTLAVNQRATLNIRLAVGALSQSVQVSAEAASLDASSAQLGTVVSQEKIVDLPLNARNFTQLLILTPGATPVNVSQNSNGGRTQAVGVRVYPAVNGQSNRSDSFLLDGVYNNASLFSTYAIAPNIDALSEFKVESHGDQAEFGGTTGGVVNVVTKSGTNQFHGAGWWFIRNDALDARGFFTTTKPPLRQNQFGATLGGPVKHDKTFFFFSYEGYRQKNPASKLSLIPTPEELAGDFSALSRRLYDPFSTRADPAKPTVMIRDAFPGNRIPADRINKSTQAWAQAIIPKPMNTGVAGYNYRNNFPTTMPLNQYSIRVDHHFSSNDSLWARYTWDVQDQQNAGAFQETYTTVDNKARNAGLSYTRVLSNSTVLNGLFGYAGLGQDRGSFLTETNLFDKGFFPGFPKLRSDVPAPEMLGASNNSASDGPNEAYQFRGDLSHVRGRHTLKFGGELVRVLNHAWGMGNSLTFDSRQTADLSNLSATGYNFASFVIGVPSAWSVNDKVYEYGMSLGNLYAQDSWRATDRLTVNFGLRWDLTTYPTFSVGFPSTWDFNTGRYIVGSKPLPACSSSQVAPCLVNPNDAYVQQYVIFQGTSKLRPNNYRQLGPRFGFAYRLSNNTVVRGSYGIFWDREAGVLQQAQNGMTGWPRATTIQSLNINQTLVDVTVDNPLGKGVDPRFPAANPATSQSYFWNPKSKWPYSEQWNFDVQRLFSNNLTVTLGYVGSHNLNLPVGGSYNTALKPGPGAVAPRALFPWAPVSNYDRSIGQSSYNGFQAKAEQRFKKGLSYLLAYTWSKSIDTSSSGQFGVENESLQDPYNPNESRSVSGFDVPHTFSAALVYELPFGRGKPWVTSGPISRVLGNWQVNTMLLIRSGQPHTILANVDSANIGALSGVSRVRPNLVGDPVLSNPTPGQWFNKAAFVAPPAYTLGNLGRNTMRTDGYNNIDFSLFREDRLTERVKSQFRVEAFNLFNTPTFGIPDSSFISTNFGRVSSTVSTARQVQLGLKFIF